jgi:hypothetical protein
MRKCQLARMKNTSTKIVSATMKELSNMARTGRPPQVIQSVSRHVRLPAPLMTELELHLYSSVEGRVPYGALSEFLTQASRDLLDKVYGKQAKGMKHIPGGKDE